MYIYFIFRPSEDGEFEKLLIRNLSFTVFIFTHYNIPTSDFVLQHKQNNTHVYRTTIVPNDPADFSRNSYDTQTVNNVLTTLRHKHLDILKIDNVADTSRSHDILYYLVKDGTLKNVGQLHIVLRIGKFCFILILFNLLRPKKISFSPLVSYYLLTLQGFV